MLFLITKISLLILAAALAGAGLMYWWIRRQFEDVTDGYELMANERGALQSIEDRLSVLERLEEKVQGNALVLREGFQEAQRDRMELLDAWTGSTSSP